MPARSPADIYSILVYPIRAHSLAREMGVLRGTMTQWIKGSRPMPAHRRRQLADLIEQRKIPIMPHIVDQLRHEADVIDRCPHKKSDIAKNWLTPGQPPAHTKGTKVKPAEA